MGSQTVGEVLMIFCIVPYKLGPSVRGTVLFSKDKGDRDPHFVAI